MRKVPDILATETIARTRLFRVERVNLRFANGTEVQYERLPGSRTGSVLAEDLYERRLPGDEPEAIEVVPWRLSEFAGLLARDDFTEARSVAALFLTREVLAGRPSS